MSTSRDVQYIKGISCCIWGYHEYIIGCAVHWGYHDVCGGYHEYIGLFNIDSFYQVAPPHES